MKAPAAWRPATRVVFRFVFVYLILYMLPFPVGSVPYTEALAEPYTELWNAIIPRVGRDVLKLDYEVAVAFNGSGDRTYDYVQVLVHTGESMTSVSGRVTFSR